MSPFDIFVFLAVLGVLIFVHELGHFVAAKACGVYVDRFSLGMPPRIFGFQIGETDYCIGLLPIGGYVKMAGQEDAPLSDEERDQTYGHVPSERWFNNRPKWQRATILAAGPLMNLVLAFFIYAFMAAAGSDVPMSEVEARVGFVEDGSPASLAAMYRADTGAVDFSAPPDSIGWKTGDQIVSVDGNEMTKFEDVFMEAVLGAGKAARIVIDRPDAHGETTRYICDVEPLILDDRIKATRFGFAPFSSGLIQHVLPGTPAEEQGLKAGDVIVGANGTLVDAQSFSRMVKQLPAGSEIDIDIRRDGEIIPTKIATRSEGNFEGLSLYPPLNPAILIADEPDQRVVLEDPAFQEMTGLKKGDLIVGVNDSTDIGSAIRRIIRSGDTDAIEAAVIDSASAGQRESADVRKVQLSADQLVHALTGIDQNAPVQIAAVDEATRTEFGLKREDVILEIDGQPATLARLREVQSTRVGETVSIKLQRPAKAWGLVRRESVVETEVRVESIELIGVVWGMETVFKRTPPGQVIPVAAEQCYRTTAQIGTTLAMLVTGNLSPKMLGGPVMIAQAVTTTARISFFALLSMVALISVNLFVFNLLPLPVLDGGQLTFLAIEAIRRKPVSLKVMEAVQQVGILLIIGLIVYVTFNDVNRWVDNWLPK